MLIPNWGNNPEKHCFWTKSHCRSRYDVDDHINKNLRDELDDLFGFDVSCWLHFYPLGEFVDIHKHELVAISPTWKRSEDVKPLNRRMAMIGLWFVGIELVICYACYGTNRLHTFIPDRKPLVGWLVDKMHVRKLYLPWCVLQHVLCKFPRGCRIGAQCCLQKWHTWFVLCYFVCIILNHRVELGLSDEFFGLCVIFWNCIGD